MVLDNDYIDAMGDNIDLSKIMMMEDQEKQVIKEVEEVKDPRKIPERKTVDDNAIFEQQCVVPDLHPMHSLPVLTCKEYNEFMYSQNENLFQNCDWTESESISNQHIKGTVQ